MSVEEYLKNFAANAPALKKIQRAARSKGADRLSEKAINEEIKRYRRQRSARNA
jgi:hypothetical protein